ncbi:MAG: tRNA (N6-threonylcarbamoyladenosine(37)-N6)-methyltransferase TrmO [Chloroflexi bacterium]|nr:tRNA (N6-threonylcarbamoyladenosine(37)-N6)-methyltransferase TrmO [Chloroflexota bacterium]
METMDEIEIGPIGFVRNKVKDKEYHGWRDVVSDILVKEEYVPGLEGLADFSHVIVLFWLHRVTPEERATQKARPLRKAEIPELGVFAWHSSRRPNPIGMSTVKLLGVENGRVRVQGLDAIDGTPVLDLRPYVAEYYRVDRPAEPAWVAQAMQAVSRPTPREEAMD